MRSCERWLKPNGPPAVVCVRLLVGLVFFSEGVQKFLFPDTLGPGRFVKIGIPAPEFFAILDGVVEIACGVLVVLGLVTRLAAIPLLIDICGAIVLTKIPELRPGGSGAWRDSGVWHMTRAPTSPCCWD